MYQSLCGYFQSTEMLQQRLIRIVVPFHASLFLSMGEASSQPIIAYLSTYVLNKNIMFTIVFFMYRVINTFLQLDLILTITNSYERFYHYLV